LIPGGLHVTAYELSIGKRFLARTAGPVLFTAKRCLRISRFRGRRGVLIKVIWWDGQGACLFSKRFERGRFVWPSSAHGKVSVTATQLAMLLEDEEIAASAPGDP
jgi:transposase